VAAISDDLAARVFAGATDPSEPLRSPAGVALTPGLSAPVSMIMLRYPDPGTAGKIASKDALKSKKDAEASLVQVELVIWADRDGRRHVADPSHGVKAWAKSDLISWELFGPVVGALAGALGGGGVHSFVTDAVVTGIGWAVFGLVAGALYGLWAGRAVSARRLKRLSPFIAPGTSMIVAWAGGPGRHRRALRTRFTAADPSGSGHQARDRTDPRRPAEHDGKAFRRNGREAASSTAPPSAGLKRRRAAEAGVAGDGRSRPPTR
jgi:hypothetical protein